MESIQKGLSKEQIDGYLKSSGEMCPKCKSPEIITDSMLFHDEETNKVYQDKSCLTCDFEWTDVWSLDGIKEPTLH